jgi:hypothetical protein
MICSENLKAAEKCWKTLTVSLVLSMDMFFYLNV